MSNIRDLIADDSYAASFQTLGQYRTALLTALKADSASAKVARAVAAYRNFYAELAMRDALAASASPECDACNDTVRCDAMTGTTCACQERAMLAAASAPIPSDDELPGMWSGADLIGGATDTDAAGAPIAVRDVGLENFLAPTRINPKTLDLVARFAGALAAKLAQAERRYGCSDEWASPDWMDECRGKLLAHMAKGDPRDVAAYCAFLWHHGERTAASPAAAAAVDEAMVERALNARMGLNTTVSDMLACPGLSDSATRWRQNIMRAALAAALSQGVANG